MLYVPHNSKEIRHAYISKHNSTCENQVILFMITETEKWHCVIVKNLPALFREKTSKHVGDFNCLNCLHSLGTKNKLKKHEEVCKNHGYYYIKIPEKDKSNFKYNRGEKSWKALFIIYADTESLLTKIDRVHSNPESSSATKINKHRTGGYSLFTNCSFDATKNKRDYYRDKN